MRYVYFDSNNEIRWDSDDMTDDEQERLDDWIENRCYQRWYDLDTLKIYNNGRMKIQYYDNKDEAWTEEDID